MLLSCVSFPLFLPGDFGSSMGATAFYPHGQYTINIPTYSDERPKSAEDLSRYTADSVPRPGGRLVLSLQVSIVSGKPSNKLHPFATDMAFGA